MQFNKLAGFCTNILKVKLYLNTAPPPKKKKVIKFLNVLSYFSQDGLIQKQPEKSNKALVLKHRHQAAKDSDPRGTGSEGVSHPASDNGARVQGGHWQSGVCRRWMD